MDRLDKIIKKYVEHFNENLPIYGLDSELLSSEDKLEEFVNKCIAENKPFIPNYEDELLY